MESWSEDFIEIQEEFIKAVDEISYLHPELALEIADRIHNDPHFFRATGRVGDDFLLQVLDRRKAKGITTNIVIHGGEAGGTQVGKSITALIIAFFEDPTFSIKRVFFDFTELINALPDTLPRSRYIVDDVRRRFGTGSKAEVYDVENFLEAGARSGTSLTICKPEPLDLPSIHYTIEMLGYCEAYSLGILYGSNLKPIAWLRFEIPGEIKPLINEYYDMKLAYIEQLRKKAGGVGGYVSGKVERLMQDIQESGHVFDSPKRLKRFIILNYDHWTQKVQEAAFIEVKELLFPEEEDITDTIEVLEGQEFHDFLLDYLPPSLLRSIVELYSADNLPRQDEVAKELQLDSAARVSEQITRFTERQLGDLFEIWYNGGGTPAKEGEVDAFEEGVPTNLKATYSSRKTLRIPAEKMKPELDYALAKGCPVRIRAYNLFFDKLVIKEFQAQDILKRGVAIVNFE